MRQLQHEAVLRLFEARHRDLPGKVHKAAALFISADDKAISGRLNMLVKQNLLLISNRYSMWMTLYRAKAIESNFVFMQVKGAVYKGMSRLVISRELVPQFFSCVYLLKHNILCSSLKMNTGYGTDCGLQLKQREASFPHYNLIVRKESDGITDIIEAILMVH